MVKWVGLAAILAGLWYLISRRQPPPPITCPTGYHLVNGACVPDTPIPPITTGIVDNFDNGTFVLNEGAISPNGLWRGVYVSGGALQQKKMAGSATDGVMSLEPRAVTAPDQTSAPLILSTRDLTNFDMSFQMRTVAQLRTGSAPHNWETAWILFRYTDVTHHYYFVIKNNGLELGKKDNAIGNTNLEDQIFLATPGYPPLVLGQWYTVRIIAQGFHIQVFVNGIKLIDFTDPDVHDPTKMSHGMIGLYAEDSRVEFNNVNAVALP